MRKVLFIVHSLNVGGTEILVANLARYFSSKYQVAILALDSIGRIGEELNQQEIPVFCSNRQPGWKVQNFKNIFQIIREYQPDLIHAHQYSPFFYAAVAKIFCQTKAKLIFTEHGRHYPDEVSKKRQLINQLLWRQVTTVTAVCHFSAQALQDQEKYPGKVEVIYNGIASKISEEQVDLRAAYQLPEEAVLIVYLGTFRAVKNPGLLIEAMNLVVKSNPNIFAVFIGDGKERDALTNLIEKYQLQKNVILLGELRDVERYWSNFNFLVQPSLSEAHSLALLEAMSHGLPAIVTKVGGAAEVIREGENGFLVTTNDYQTLADKILLLAGDPALQIKLGDQAKTDFLQKFDSRVMCDNYQDLYVKLLGS